MHTKRNRENWRGIVASGSHAEYGLVHVVDMLLLVPPYMFLIETF